MSDIIRDLIKFEITGVWKSPSHYAYFDPNIREVNMMMMMINPLYTYNTRMQA